MDDNKPFKLTRAEFDEIGAIKAVQELFGLDDEDSDLSSVCYAVRFRYQEDGPGYAGDLYILQGGAVDSEPSRLIRINGRLELVG